MYTTMTIAAEQAVKASSDEVLHVRVKELKPLIEKWRMKNPNVPVTHLLRRGLKLALKPVAGKRYAHLVEVS